MGLTHGAIFFPRRHRRQCVFRSRVRRAAILFIGALFGLSLATAGAFLTVLIVGALECFVMRVLE
jgi:hypothetical protein